jgi:hypothetical protein
MWRYVKCQSRDLVELFVLPALALLLPWSLCYKIFRWICKFDWFYREHVRSNIDEALIQGFLKSKDVEVWRQKIRLTRLIDLADFYLILTRNDKWLMRHLRIDGNWPAKGAGFLCTFHWGGGMWAMRSARIAGLIPHMMLAKFDPIHYADQPVLLHYAKYRTLAVERETGFKTIDPKSSKSGINAALQAENQVMVVMDVPPDAVRSSVSVQFLGRQVRMPIGLLKIAAKSKVPITVFSMGYDFDTGMRFLSLKEIPANDDPNVLAIAVYDELSILVENNPALWHFWAQLPRFMA